MSQNKIEKENPQKPVILSQSQNESQVEIALSQQASQSEVSVSGSQISQGQSQDRATVKTDDSQGTSASQAQIAPQENVSTQASVSTQDTSSRARGRLRSQMSDTCNSLLNRIPDRPKYSRIKNIDDLIPEHRYLIPHKIGIKRLLDRWMAKNEQSDSQDGETLTKTRKLLDDKNFSQPKSQ